MNEVFFYLFAGLSVAFAAVAVTAKNIIRGGVALLGSFVALGAVYFTAGAEFVGIVQVIVYGGAIVVLYLFALMTMDLKKMKEDPFRAGSVAIGSFLSLAVIVLLITGGLTVGGEVEPQISGATEIAMPLFYKFLLPFEIVSVLLLVATIGAVAIGRRDG